MRSLLIALSLLVASPPAFADSPRGACAPRPQVVPQRDGDGDGDGGADEGADPVRGERHALPIVPQIGTGTARYQVFAIQASTDSTNIVGWALVTADYTVGKIPKYHEYFVWTSGTAWSTTFFLRPAGDQEMTPAGVEKLTQTAYKFPNNLPCDATPSSADPGSSSWDLRTVDSQGKTSDVIVRLNKTRNDALAAGKTGDYLLGFWATNDKCTSVVAPAGGMLKLTSATTALGTKSRSKFLPAAAVNTNAVNQSAGSVRP